MELIADTIDTRNNKMKSQLQFIHVVKRKQQTPQLNESSYFKGQTCRVSNAGRFSVFTRSRPR